MKVRSVGITSIPDSPDYITLVNKAAFFSLDGHQVGISGRVPVSVVYDDGIAQFIHFPCRFDSPAAGSKDRVTRLCGKVRTEVRSLFGILLAHNAHDRDKVWDVFHAEFFFESLPAVRVEIDIVLFGRRMGEPVAVDDGIDLVGVVLDERLEDILDSVLHDPQ